MSLKRFHFVQSLAVLLFILLISGCTENQPPAQPQKQNEIRAVKHVGQISDAFKAIVENNAFNGITAFDGRLLKAEIRSTDENTHTVEQQVQMMDLYGHPLAAYTCTSSDAYHVTTLTATEDGGFLFVLSFEDYAIEQGVWASDNGFASRVIKCDKDGNLQFDTPFDGLDGTALKFCFEKDGHFYLFGDSQTPETKTPGVYSPTDLYSAILNQNGDILESKRIAGSDYDKLDSAELSDNGFVLSVNSQSDDGDFAGSDSKGHPVNWVIALNDNLDITAKKKESGRGFFDTRIGEKDGKPVYKSSSLLKDFDAGTPEAFIDYGDFYLIISENNTGIYEKTPPYVNSIWYYTETVYSAYDTSGNLLFRTSVDSSPDFNSMLATIDTQS